MRGQVREAKGAQAAAPGARAAAPDAHAAAPCTHAAASATRAKPIFSWAATTLEDGDLPCRGSRVIAGPALEILTEVIGRSTSHMTTFKDVRPPYIPTTRTMLAFGTIETKSPHPPTVCAWVRVQVQHTAPTHREQRASLCRRAHAHPLSL